ncbi:MAG: hypothetical protein RLY43_1197 [Bacteroidota bacterium]
MLQDWVNNKHPPEHQINIPKKLLKPCKAERQASSIQGLFCLESSHFVRFYGRKIQKMEIVDWKVKSF